MFFANAMRINRNKCGRFLRSSPSENSNAWSPRSSWTWSRKLPRKNCKVRIGSTWWHKSNRSYEDMRVAILEFLDTDVFEVSIENCVSFLDPLIESWDIDLETFGVEIVLNQRLTLGQPKRYEFVEREPEGPSTKNQASRSSSMIFRSAAMPPRGNRISEEAKVQGQAASSALLLPGAAKPERPSSLPHSRQPENQTIEEVRTP